LLRLRLGETDEIYGSLKKDRNGKVLYTTSDMGNTWITDMTHFLDESGELVSGMRRRAELLVIHFGRIVARAVEEEWGMSRDTGWNCPGSGARTKNRSISR